MTDPRSTYQEFYDRHYPRLAGSGLWLRGGEMNRVEPALARGASLRVLFARLSTYADTADSFTHPLLYAMAADLDGVYPDLAFLPPPKDGALMASQGVPWLLGTQSKLGPTGFDLIGLSNSIAQELVNLPAMLSRSGIPFSKTERLARPEIPLIVLGGANATFTSVLQNAPPEITLVDGIYIGEDPREIARLLTLCRDGKKSGASKESILESLESLDGFFQPDRPRATRKTHWLPEQYAALLLRMPVLYGESAVGKWPLSEGCPAFCGFCAESWTRKPYRETSLATFTRQAMRYKAAAGLEALEFYSFNFNMHAELFGVLWEAVERFDRLALKSQRFDWLATSPELPAMLNLLGKSSLTCGLEGISPRLRRFLRKSLDEENLWRGLANLASARLRELKIFLIATGREEEQDYQACSEFLGRLRALFQRDEHPPRVILSVTPLVRFPWTPLEFDPAPTAEAMEAVLDRIDRLAAQHGFEARRAADTAEYLISQILLRTDRSEVLPALLEAWEKTGFVYYREMRRPFLHAFLRALEGRGLRVADLLKGVEPNADKPWTMHATGVRREFLWEQYRKALQFEDDGYCLGRPGKPAVCQVCGACPDRETRHRLTHAKQDRPFTLKAFSDRIKQTRQSVFTLDFAVRVDETARGVARVLVGAKLASALMRSEPSLAPYYRACVRSWLSEKLGPYWAAGHDVLTLAWREPARPILERLLSQPEWVEQVNQRMKPWGGFLGIVRDPRRIVSVTYLSPYPFEINDWLKPRGLKCVARRPAPGRMVFDLTKDSLKKRVVESVESREIDDGVRAAIRHQVIVKPGPKFDLEAFAREAFRLPTPEEWVRVEIEARIYCD